MDMNKKNNFRIFFNGKSIPLFRSLSRREHSFLSIFLKSQIFIFPEIWRNGGEDEIRFNEFFTKILKIPPYIQLFILQ